MTVCNVPTWLSDLTNTSPVPGFSAWQAFMQSGLPTTKDERFKYADFSFLSKHVFTSAIKQDLSKEAIAPYRLRVPCYMLVCVDGFFMPHLSDISLLPKNINVSYTTGTDFAQESMQSPFYLLNMAMAQSRLVINVAANCKLEKPIQLLLLTTQDNVVVSPSHHLIVGENAKVDFIETYYSNTISLTNSMLQVDLHKNAKLNYTKIQNEHPTAYHLAHLLMTQQDGSETVLVNCTRGGIFSRDDVVVNLKGIGATCETSGFYHLNKPKQFVDHHIDINHEARLTKSDMLYKGIIAEKARAVFNGRLHVSKDAQQINALQTNHHLLLSKQAEAYAKPELEIYADDVKCKHGATTGQIDEAALFFLRARGIPEKQAISLLISGFAEEILNRVIDTRLRDYLKGELSWQA